MEYHWITAIGFWATLGILQAIAVALIVVWIIGKLVDYIFSKLTWFHVSLTEYVFTSLPDEYTSMNVTYDSRNHTITAKASYLFNGEVFESQYTVKVVGKAYETFSHNAQLELMTNIKKEQDRWKSKKNT